MLNYIVIRVFLTVDGSNVATGILRSTKVDNAHAGIFATAIDIGVNMTTRDADCSVATHHTCPLHRRINIVFRFIVPRYSDRCRMLMVTAAIATAIHATFDFTARNCDGSILANSTELSAAIDIAGDEGIAAADVHRRGL